MLTAMCLKYDRNAIRIDNVQGTQIGHIPRKLAAKLAPYMVMSSSMLKTMFVTGLTLLG